MHAVPSGGTLVLVLILLPSFLFQKLKIGFPLGLALRVTSLPFFYDPTSYKQRQPSPSHPTPPKPQHHRQFIIVVSAALPSWF
jgi:hypothetical protein